MASRKSQDKSLNRRRSVTHGKSQGSKGSILCSSVSPVFKVLSRLHQHRRPHILNNAVRELAGLNFCSAVHEPLKVIRDFLLKNGTFHPSLDQIGRLVPSHESEHHHAR